MSTQPLFGGFLDYQPDNVDNFRGIVLFGRNVASYKFALAKSIVDLVGEGKDRATLEELAVPFSAHIVEHIERAPKQSVSRSSAFLDACRDFQAGQISRDELTKTTARLGFVNVIDAFHVVGRGDVSTRFFVDERRTSTGGIILTDAAFDLLESNSSFDPTAEIEARWQLVESAWHEGIDTSLVRVDSDLELFVSRDRRANLCSARDSLNGYQRGACFYCFRPISTQSGSIDLADVDHLLPHVLQRRGVLRNLDGVWNLVLACRACNRGPNGKSDSIPNVKYLERLHRRNEYLIASAHPLKETLIAQTGSYTQARNAFLQSVYNEAAVKPSYWETPQLAAVQF
jgi:hypothetical protein